MSFKNERNYESIEEFCKHESNDKVLYVASPEGEMTFGDIFLKVKEHFGHDVSLEDVSVRFANIQFRNHSDNYPDPDYYDAVAVFELKQA